MTVRAPDTTNRPISRPRHDAGHGGGLGLESAPGDPHGRTGRNPDHQIGEQADEHRDDED